MTRATDPCLRCGEPTASGALYSDRHVVRDARGERYLCSLCAEILARERRPGLKDEPRGNLDVVIDPHIPFGH